MNRIERQLESVDVIQHAHVKRGRCRPLFLVSAHVDVVVVVPPVSQPVNPPRISMERKHHRCSRRKDLVVLLVRQSMRMLRLSAAASSGPPHSPRECADRAPARAAGKPRPAPPASARRRSTPSRSPARRRHSKPTATHPDPSCNAPQPRPSVSHCGAGCLPATIKLM